MNATINFKTLCFLQLLAIGLAGCESKDDTIIVPENNISADIASFFEEELPNMEISNSFFTNENQDAELCYVINNTRDLQDIYTGKKDLPPIDYNDKTLVIGKVRMPNSYYYVSGQEIVILDKGAVINLKIKPVSTEGRWPAFSTLYFWGVYPKISVKNLSIHKSIQ